MAMSNSLSTIFSMTLTNGGITIGGGISLNASTKCLNESGLKHESNPTPVETALTDYNTAGTLTNLDTAKRYFLAAKNFSTDTDIYIIPDQRGTVSISPVVLEPSYTIGNGHLVYIDAVVTYSAGNVILWTDGFLYVCLSATSAGNDPTDTPLKWRKLSTITVPFGRGVLACMRGGFWMVAGTGSVAATTQLACIQDEL